MATEKTRKADILTPLCEGEFWRITGIAEATEKRLWEAGIKTFRQLASLTPIEIASLLPGQVGVKERAARQDWAGQADKLADLLEHDLSRPMLAPKDKDTLPADEHVEQHHYESFLVELLLDDEHHTRRTRISQVRNGSRDGWSGWDPTRLGEWIATQTGMSETEPDAFPARRETREPLVQRPVFGGKVSIWDVTLVSHGGERLRRFSTCGQGIELRLKADLQNAVMPTDDQVAYHVIVEAARFGSRERIELGQEKGFWADQSSIALSIPLTVNEEGTYRLAVKLLAYPAGSLEPEKDGITAHYDSGLIHIFDRAMVVR